MRNEINEPTKNNLPNDMIDWNEISEFIIDMLDPKYRGNKGWKVINDNYKDKVKHARTYASKKACKKSIAFYEAVQYHLERLKKIESETKN